MVQRKQIDQLAASIADQFRPEQIVLFGSYAYGKPTADSDVDMLIVMRHRGPSYRLAARIRNSLDVAFPVDVLVRSPNELRKQMESADPFMREILSKGKVLHGPRNKQLDR